MKLQAHPHDSQKYPECRLGTRSHREYTRYCIGKGEQPDGTRVIGNKARLWERASPRLLAAARKIAMDDQAPMPPKKCRKLRALVSSMLGNMHDQSL